MRLLHYVLTASAILVAGTDGSTKTVDPKTEIVARPLSFDFLRVNKTPSIASSLPKQHPYDETSTNGDERQENEERMFSDPAAPNGLSELVKVAEDALVEAKETFKKIGEGAKADKVVGQKITMDHEVVLPLQHDELQAQKRHEYYAELSAAAREAIIKGIGRKHRNAKQIRTDKLIENLKMGMIRDKIVVKGKIVDEDRFFQLLLDGFSTSDKAWNYDDVVKSLLKLDDDSLHRVEPEELMETLYSLRSMKGMKKYADRMLRVLADRFTASLMKRMFPLWLERKVSPYEVFEMLPTGNRANYHELSRDVAEGVFDRAVLPMSKYIELYVKKGYDFSDKKTFKLMHGQITHGLELNFVDFEKSADNLPDRGWSQR